MRITNALVLLTILTLTFAEELWTNFKTFKATSPSISKNLFDYDEISRTLIVAKSGNDFRYKPQAATKLSQKLFHSAVGDFALSQRRKLDNSLNGDPVVSHMKNITHDINGHSHIKHSHRRRPFQNRFDLGLSDSRFKRSVYPNNPLLRKHKRTSRNSKVSNSRFRARKCPQLHRSKRKLKPICTRGKNIGSRCKIRCKPGYYSPSKSVKKYRRCKEKKTRHPAYLTIEARWTGRDSDFKCVPICDLHPKLENGSTKCRLVGEDMECTFSCNENFKLWGSEKRKCISKKQWTGDPPFCTLNREKQELSPKYSIRFDLHQNFTCGNVQGLSTFTSGHVPYMLTTNYNDGLVKIYKWEGDRFGSTPLQEISFFAPMRAEILRDLNNKTWLVIANSDFMTFYRMSSDGRFAQSHSNDSSLIFPNSRSTVDSRKKDAIAFAELRGEIYRCYGRNRRASPFVIVQKLQGAPQKLGGRKTVFQRIMRKRLSDEYVQRCSMYADRGSIYTIVALNKDNGKGRIIIGEVSNQRRGMNIVTVISGEKLMHLSDSIGFSSTNGSRYIIASQNVRNGQCMIYKRHWKPA